MAEFVFILGKNAELSRAELESCLNARRTAFETTDSGEEFLVVRAERLPPKMMEGLGGTLKIGEVIFSGEGVENADFDKEFSSLPEKALFAVSTYGPNIDGKALAEALKKKMKEAGVSAGYLHNDQTVSHTEIVKKRLLEKGAEFLACRGKRFWLARTTAVHDPFEFRRRDLERPVQRAIFSIPPRLCRIMANLTGKTDGILLDPFCGVGSILQEAALMGFDVRGEDIDDAAVRGCRKNLDWLAKEYGITISDLDEKIRQGDARKLGAYFAEGSVDAVVTEPYLGEPLRERPNLREAQKILEGLGPLYEGSLREMAKILKPHGRIVIVSPFFDAEGKKTGLDMAGLAGKAKLRLLMQIPDFEERHRTLRMINVLQKD